LKHGRIEVRRDAGKLSRLAALLQESPVEGTVGIGHTRWATHGEPNARNAHPHLGATGEVVVVHNGIVENFRELRAELAAGGAVFRSETDTETIAHLLEKWLADGLDLQEAARRTLHMLRGHQSVVILSARNPDVIVAARLGNAGGVVVGVGENEMFLASDLPAILEHTREMIFLEPQQMVVLRRDSASFFTMDGETVEGVVQNVPWDPIAAEKGEYRHFMQKEIHEQVRSLTDTISGRVDFESGTVNLPTLGVTQGSANKIRRISIVACGTAYYAAQVGKYLIENIARIPVDADIASEFRYRNPIIDRDTVVLAISQSGETADTLAAMAEGRARGGILWSIVNTIGSQAMRISDGYLSMQVGPEIGVASTKAYTAPLIDLYLLAVYLADLRGTLTEAERASLLADLSRVPDYAGLALDREPEVERIAGTLKDVSHCLFLGRGINMPTAYEGALKLKEISYIHAEGYPGGEMKHGPIALVDQNMPVVAICLNDPWYEKMMSQAEQIKARGGRVIALATDGDERISTVADEVIWVPRMPWSLSPAISVIPLQLLAYHIAVLRGLDVDQPRNLAKSVTVE
jgi:glucosamine--fructose-6-phosphate aminotransferase (isomerizing)